jgi:hypothetical protein
MCHVGDATVASNGYFVTDLHAAVAHDMNILFDARAIAYAQCRNPIRIALLYFQTSAIPDENSFANMNELGVGDEQGPPQDRSLAEMTEKRPV